MNSVRLRQVMLVAMVAAVALASGSVVFAQEAARAGGGNDRAVLHLFGAALGLGMIVIGAALGIGRFAAAAAEGIARQPAAADKITGAVNLPLFLLEGVAILAEVFVLLIVLLNGRP
jgi:F-type H+-transporting ATPase subunit c